MNIYLNKYFVYMRPPFHLSLDIRDGSSGAEGEVTSAREGKHVQEVALWQYAYREMFWCLKVRDIDFDMVLVRDASVLQCRI